jgi:hypothetical protein
LWRARSHSLVGAGLLPSAKLETILKDGAQPSAALGIPVDGKGDFVVFGAAYAQLGDERFQLCSRLAEARLRALRWLLSDESWLDVDMSS